MSDVQRTLVLLRHGKSDWSGGHDDRDRPLKERGRRQAQEAGRWLAAHGPAIELAVVSPARRAADTWSLASAELTHPCETRLDDRAYTFGGDGLLALVHDLPGEAAAVALVGHNPALEELVGALTGEEAAMPTACLAVVSWAGSWRDAGRKDPGEATLVAHGRPPSPPL